MIYHTLSHTHTANINDRSMVGDRDSELAMMIESREFSHGLRCQLTRLTNYLCYHVNYQVLSHREHLGLETDDAIADNFEASYAVR